jgi:hypothetical protein
MADTFKRIAIGFAGGGSLALRVDDGKLDKLVQALRAGGWHSLETPDGDVELDLSQVTYVRTENAEHRVGFGG